MFQFQQEKLWRNIAVQYSYLVLDQSKNKVIDI